MYIRSLDGIRAAAVMLVFLAHAGLNDRVPGNFGVTVFFFLSGFLITTLMRVEYEGTATVDLLVFYARRALRILPPFYAVLAAASVLSLLGLLAGPPLQASALLGQAFHLSNYWVIWYGWWDGRAPGTWIYWSLAVEEHFYLAFPLVYLFLRRRGLSNRDQAVVLLGICGLVLAWRCLLVLQLHVPKERTYVATDTRIDSILFGCALAVWGNPVLDRRRIPDGLLKYGLIPASLAGLAVTFLVRESQFQETVRYTLQGVCLFPLFIGAMRLPDWFPFSVLSLSPVRFLGVISYSVYLLHPTVLFGVAQWVHASVLLQGSVALAVTLALAVGIHFGLERPAAAMRRRISRGHRPRRSTPSRAAMAETSAPS